jgi:hypothetical protein
VMTDPDGFTLRDIAFLQATSGGLVATESVA